jgi:hypothetical protein
LVPPPRPGIKDWRPRTLKLLKDVVRNDAGDLWMRFYEGAPDLEAHRETRVLPLRAPLSFFQNGIEVSRDSLDLVATNETLVSGESIPVKLSAAHERFHLISIPDQRPSGPYQLRIRLARAGEVRGNEAWIEVEGVGRVWPPPAGADAQTPLLFPMFPLQADLMHVYLDGAAIRARTPGLGKLIIREVAAIPR